MQFYRDLSVKYKLLIGFGLTAAFCAVLGWVATTNLQLLATADTRLYTCVTVPSEQLGDIAESVQRIRVALRDTLMAERTESVSHLVDSIAELNRDVIETADEFKKTIMSTEMDQVYTEFRDGFDRYVPLQKSVLQLAQAGENAKALELLRGDCKESSRCGTSFPRRNEAAQA